MEITHYNVPDVFWKIHDTIDLDYIGLLRIYLKKSDSILI
jgi:hypothetical protein|tara:strand:- start:105 stop:224 length:120 start_codon:yes stop_codon:yes gene_type:complete